MPSFEEIFAHHISKAIASGDIAEADANKATQALVTEISSQILKGLKRRMPRMLRQHHKLDKGFVIRNYRRWKKALDLLEMMCVVSEEAGSKFNDTHRPAAVAAKDYAFEALVTLHARSILIIREIICLLKGGFPDGALSRWRSLHELAATAQFLQKYDVEVSHRYLASFDFNALRAAKQMNKYADRANLEKFSPEELQAMEGRCTALAARFGEEMYNEPRPRKRGPGACVFGESRRRKTAVERREAPALPRGGAARRKTGAPLGAPSPRFMRGARRGRPASPRR